jgi:hypothetical protein
MWIMWVLAGCGVCGVVLFRLDLGKIENHRNPLLLLLLLHKTHSTHFWLLGFVVSLSRVCVCVCVEGTSNSSSLL